MPTQEYNLVVKAFITLITLFCVEPSSYWNGWRFVCIFSLYLTIHSRQFSLLLHSVGEEINIGQGAVAVLCGCKSLATHQPSTTHWVHWLVQERWASCLHYSKEYGVYYLYPHMPSVLWRCWLGSKKGIWPVKNWVVGCWHGYMSGSRCRFAYGPADATATHCLLLQ